MAARLLYVSMLGEPDLYDPAAFTALCPSGLERDWVVDWHGATAAAHGFDLWALDICRGEPLPPPEDVDAVILGGTFHSVAEDRVWLDDLSDWLARYRTTGRPLLGICGGHQLLATRMEPGVLLTRPDGPLTGTIEIGLTAAGRAHPLFCGLPARPRFHFGNGQYVDPAPAQMPGVLAIAPAHPVVAFDHGGGWLSCQFHPEARKPEFDCYFSPKDPAYESPYEDIHDGPAVIDNFLALAAGRLGRLLR